MLKYSNCLLNKESITIFSVAIATIINSSPKMIQIQCIFILHFNRRTHIVKIVENNSASKFCKSNAHRSICVSLFSGVNLHLFCGLFIIYLDAAAVFQLLWMLTINQPSLKFDCICDIMLCSVLENEKDISSIVKKQIRLNFAFMLNPKPALKVSELK